MYFTITLHHAQEPTLVTLYLPVPIPLVMVSEESFRALMYQGFGDDDFDIPVIFCLAFQGLVFH